ncbi:hypothetical protein [Croceivirga radicis]|uniref:DUF3575 domain-containing protein n=1 Tax=Croceivirga radicis TaxID=1929488 RepID=A0A1V6LQ34_9FLAO|nr:hypothetical protein [Croceivirga radicis]OQD42248.1 hypothetical protein BUL40_12030 [Croceivirga radicis]
MKIIYTTLMALGLIMPVMAQNRQVEESQITLNLLLPGVIYEAAVGDRSTMALEGTIGFQYVESSFSESGFGIYPIGRLQYRNYLNFDRRLSKGKNIAGNSGNYIAPLLAVQGGKAFIGDLDFYEDYFALAGAVYGLQRTGKKGLQFRFEVGPAYLFSEYDGGFAIATALKLGFVLGKSRR